MQEYPKMLFGPRGLDDADDHRLVQDAGEERAARADGYAMLGEAPAEAQADPAPVKRGRPRKTAD